MKICKIALIYDDARCKMIWGIQSTASEKLNQWWECKNEVWFYNQRREDETLKKYQNWQQVIPSMQRKDRQDQWVWKHNGGSLWNFSKKLQEDLDSLMIKFFSINSSHSRLNTQRRCHGAYISSTWCWLSKEAGESQSHIHSLPLQHLWLEHRSPL